MSGNAAHCFGVVLAASTLVLAGCRTVETTSAGAVGVDRKQTVTLILTQQEVQQMAARQYALVLASAQRLSVLNRDPQQVQRVRAVADRLIAETPAFRKDAIDWKWEVNVFTTPHVNAWSLLGGKIVVHSGLLELDLTDDELAAVLGHEIAHSLREHAREALPSGQHEVEADVIGVELAARAGYDPRAALTIWGKLAAPMDVGPNAWLSAHPSNEVRLRELDKAVSSVLPLREEGAVTSSKALR